MCMSLLFSLLHTEPFVVKPQNTPSTAFCLLYSLFCMRLAEDQVEALVLHDFVYARAIGFLYLRYTMDGETIWAWFKDYVDDPTPLKTKLGRSTCVYLCAILCLPR
eukprot:m.185725 g.185725  ORF g.185725 m.185725 type:complete len:106 (+) comp14735_c0_seq10:823-1140(+)